MSNPLGNLTGAVGKAVSDTADAASDVVDTVTDPVDDAPPATVAAADVAAVVADQVAQLDDLATKGANASAVAIARAALDNLKRSATRVTVIELDDDGNVIAWKVADDRNTARDVANNALAAAHVILVDNASWTVLDR